MHSAFVKSLLYKNPNISFMLHQRKELTNEVLKATRILRKNEHLKHFLNFLHVLINLLK